MALALFKRKRQVAKKSAAAKTKSAKASSAMQKKLRAKAEAEGCPFC